MNNFVLPVFGMKITLFRTKLKMNLQIYFSTKSKQLLFQYKSSRVNFTEASYTYLHVFT